MNTTNIIFKDICEYAKNNKIKYENVNNDIIIGIVDKYIRSSYIREVLEFLGIKLPDYVIDIIILWVDIDNRYNCLDEIVIDSYYRIDNSIDLYKLSYKRYLLHLMISEVKSNG